MRDLTKLFFVTLSLLSLVMTACGKEVERTHPPITCHIERNEGVTAVICSDNSVQIVPDAVGPKGDTGAVGAVGAQGEQGIAGNDGANGSDGQNGQDGAPGQNGQDATPVTVVQFCPGVIAYPSVFPENGLCIAGKLYAVYSANGGFLTELAPGAYNSNAIGSSCNFTVLANCQIAN